MLLRPTYFNGRECKLYVNYKTVKTAKPLIIQCYKNVTIVLQILHLCYKYITIVLQYKKILNYFDDSSIIKLNDTNKGGSRWILLQTIF